MKTDTAKSRPGSARLKAGFTLLELLIVIAIIAILFAIMFPAFNGMKKTARKNQATTEVNALATAVRAYHTELGRWPIPSGGPGDQNSGGQWSNNNNLIVEQLLFSRNGRRNFYQFEGAPTNAMIVCDPFRSNMAIRVQIDVPGNTVRAWSCGPDCIDQNGDDQHGNDDIQAIK